MSDLNSNALVTPFAIDHKRNRNPGGKDAFGKALTQDLHDDGDHHYIDETIPRAPSTDIRPLGQSSAAVGTSPFVASADHVHDVWPIRSVNYCNPVVCGMGENFLNGMAWNGDGVDILAPGSTQLFVFPATGFWQIYASFVIDRSGGGGFPAAAGLEIRPYYNGSPFYAATYSLEQHVGYFVCEMNHQHTLFTGTTFQMAVFCGGDAVTWSVRLQHLSFVRISI